MPFKLGVQPIRRSIKYLEAGSVMFKDRVKIMSIYYNEDEYAHNQSKVKPAQAKFLSKREFYVKGGKHHHGAQDFVFWNLPQVQYKNPNLQIVTFKNMTPSPSIICYLEDGSKVKFDIDSQTSPEIMTRLRKTLGKSMETLTKEALVSEKKDNPANFGKDCQRVCICSVPGQVPCPGLIILPKHWRGKYHFGHVSEDGEES